MTAEVLALFVDESGPYGDDARFDAFGILRDARTAPVGRPVVAHPPCQRWGRFAQGRPTKRVHVVGDDGGCFHVALVHVRSSGGVLEHPRDSQAWGWFGLPVPPARGWSPSDRWGGRSCRIDQSAYGHPAQKATWLYAVLPSYPALEWRRLPTGRTIDSMSSSDPWRWRTPDQLKDQLHALASACLGWHPKAAPPAARLEVDKPGASPDA